MTTDEIFFQKLEEQKTLIRDVSTIGWVFWPSENYGFYDSTGLRKIADEMDRRNEPIFKEYDEWCEKNSS